MTRAGHTRITQAALLRTVEAITARAFGVQASGVSARLDDDSGKLGVAVSVPLALPSLLEPRTAAGQSIVDRSREARSAIIREGLAITGMMLGRVDIRLLAGKHPAPAGTVGPTQIRRQEGTAQ
ncbi:hypothetical protein [Arthrobacter sp. Leaf69]|jgi:hypothetical protein|uniref:hypothetical protein n=1 Tax=Arthrobacter sp. Leaf69 TaxID=1736232 RepID=UPI000ADB6BA0|nr:hypothetical protein [Arthrobacter sp. Leaf69]